MSKRHDHNTERKSHAAKLEKETLDNCIIGDPNGIIILQFKHAAQFGNTEAAEIWKKIFGKLASQFPATKFQFIPHSYFQKPSPMDVERVLKSIMAIPQ